MTRYAVQLDPGNPDFLRDPYPVLAVLRATGPVLWHEPMGVWLATTHESVSQVLRNRAFGRIWTDLGTGAWDARGRPSEVRLDRLLELTPESVRREGAALDRARFDRVVDEARRVQGW